jgi:hypothetical protein
LLAFRASVNAGVKKCAQKPPVAKQNAQKFIVIKVYVVKSRGVEKIIPVNKNRNATAIAKLPRLSGSRVRLH